VLKNPVGVESILGSSGKKRCWARGKGEKTLMGNACMPYQDPRGLVENTESFTLFFKGGKKGLSK